MAASRRGTDMLWRSSLPPPEANRAVDFPPVSASLSPIVGCLRLSLLTPSLLVSSLSSPRIKTL